MISLSDKWSPLLFLSRHGNLNLIDTNFLGIQANWAIYSDIRNQPSPCSLSIVSPRPISMTNSLIRMVSPSPCPERKEGSGRGYQSYSYSCATATFTLPKAQREIHPLLPPSFSLIGARLGPRSRSFLLVFGCRCSSNWRVLLPACMLALQGSS